MSVSLLAVGASLATAALVAGNGVLAALSGRVRSSLTLLSVTAPVGALVALAAAPLVPGSPSPAGVLCGIASGVLGGLGLPLAYVLYREAPIALVVPVITCVSTLVLSGAGALRDGIAPAASVGLVLCLVAVVLVTREPRAAVPVRSPGALTRGRILFGALAVGVCFGGFAMFLGLAPAGDGIWPLAASRLAALAVAAAVIARSGLPILRRGAWTPVTVVLGLLDVGANLLLVLALSTGDLVTVGVVTALSPAISVVLARVVLGQHLTPTRTFGLLLAVVGLVASTV